MCDFESVKILFSVQDRCREWLYLQGQAQTYITIGNVETYVICHNWLPYVSVRACVCVCVIRLLMDKPVYCIITGHLLK